MESKNLQTDSNWNVISDVPVRLKKKIKTVVFHQVSVFKVDKLQNQATKELKSPLSQSNINSNSNPNTDRTVIETLRSPKQVCSPINKSVAALNVDVQTEDHKKVLNKGIHLFRPRNY